MSSRNIKRAFDIADMDEDPEDDDFDIKGSSPRKRTKRPLSKGKGAGASSKRRGLPQKRQRYDGSDISVDDEISDDDDVEEVSEDEPSSPAVLNPRTGRPARRSAAQKTYEESDVDDEPIETKSESDDDSPAAGSRVKSPEPPSLVVKLKIPSLKDSPRPSRRRGKSIRSRDQSEEIHEETMYSGGVRRSTRSRGGSKDPESDAMASGGARHSRRSSRISHSEDQPLVSLTASGRHERVERAASSTPDPTSNRRAVRGGKRPPATSAILEVSNEDLETGGAFTQEIPDTDQNVAEPNEEDAEGEVEADEDDDVGPSGSLPRRASTGGKTLIAESVQGDVEEADDEDDDPVRGGSRRRSTRQQTATKSVVADKPHTRATRQARGLERTGNDQEEGSDFEPVGEDPEDEEMSESDANTRPPKESQISEDSSSGRRATLRKRKRDTAFEEDFEVDPDELQDEIAELKAASRESKRRRRRMSEGQPAIAYEPPSRRTRGDRRDYTIRLDQWQLGEDDDQPAGPTRARGGRAAGAYRSLWETRGPFGLTGGPPANFATPGAAVAAVDSDSSDDEAQQRAPRPLGGTVGMTPTSMAAPIQLFPPLNDPAQAAPGGPANLGKITNRKALADADPLGVDQSVDFDGVGGLKSHINQLKEMVLLPLLYPEVFQRFHVTPPRGVLFHGPPGTGKTLLARALANSVSEGGRKITFYMRKGADTLSKYVGEAERQLRLLFEDARKNQPSIIFFDEIDGLAPVRSSKQDQIHATIVTTMLALMDGMDGRGQVIVIGATNRPDTVDSALRRPGRFDREFYFPLPDIEARRAIIDIHTKGWDPELGSTFKNQLASLTNGYGGADLRALCTEAALNAVQGTYPQIYQSTEKLLIDPSTIKVLAKDFMISVNKIIPSSQRASASSAAPLDSRVEPLLKDALHEISIRLDGMLPSQKRLTALEEAMYDDRDDAAGFAREMMQQDFDQARVFRPRMLIYGNEGMGQHFIGQALLHKFERLHVQNFDLSILFSDTSRSTQAAVIQLFNEARRHKPSVIYIPDVQLWYETLEPSVIKLFTGLLQSLPPNEQVLVLATMQTPEKDAKPDPSLLRDLFGFSQKSHYRLVRPTLKQRQEFFKKVINLIKRPPDEFPDPDNRKKRQIVQLAKAPPSRTANEASAPSKEQLKAQKASDNMTMNVLKIKLGFIMDQLKREYKGFRRPAVEPDVISYLFDEQNPNMMGTDVPDDQHDQEVRPYVYDKDKHGVSVIREVASGKTYYNLELVTIEHRLSNGFYKRSQDFVADIKRLGKDAKALGDVEKMVKAAKMLTNVEVDVDMIDKSEPALKAECDRVYGRHMAREKREQEKARDAARSGQPAPELTSDVVPHESGTTDTSAPVLIPPYPHVPPQDPLSQLKSSSTSNNLSNGLSNGVGSGQHLSNGDVNDFDDEMHVPNSQEQLSSEGQGQPSGHDTQSQSLSQKAFMTPLAPGSQAQDYHNSASTTTSGQKTNKSLSSGNTQSTNGVRTEQPDLDLEIPGGSQLPDTQGTTPASSNAASNPDAAATGPSQQDVQATHYSPLPLSQSSQSPPRDAASQAMPPPVNRASVAAILNDTDVAPVRPKLVLELKELEDMHEELVVNSSGFSVDQLEQMNAQLMDAVWRKRGDWNRSRVIVQCRLEFNELVQDMQRMQGILEHSQESQRGRERAELEVLDTR